MKAWIKKMGWTERLLLVLLGVILASVCIGPVRAAFTQADLPDATFNETQSQTLLTTLNKTLEVAGDEMTGDLQLGTNSSGVAVGLQYKTNSVTAPRAGLVTLANGTALVSTAAITTGAGVSLSWQLTNGTSSGGYLARSTTITNTNFTIAAYTNSAAGVSVINASASGQVFWRIDKTY